MTKILIDDLLLRCEKPGRYTGGELNSANINKPHDFKFCMCFPDLYEVAMSNLGIRILYHMLNDMDKVLCERCFSPWVDFGEELKNANIELFSLESRTSLKSFDALGFSFQYELSYTNLLYMLKLANIPLYAKNRGEEFPLIIAGGPCMVNPLPIISFCDVICIGDGEEALAEIVSMHQKMKREKCSKNEILQALSHIKGVLVPSLKQEYTVRKAVVKDLDKAYFPEKTMVPNIEVVHDRGVVELFRGCTRGCRFCQAGMIYRPVRERKSETVYKQAKNIIKSTGFEELSLNSLSSSDYSELGKLLEELSQFAKQEKVQLALPSLRLDSFASKYVETARKSSLTFAPEAGTQRLRDVINKNITEENFQSALKQAFENGYDKVKLYFMLGLPTETFEDLDGIVNMAIFAKRLYKQVSGRNRLTITISCSTFIPKPFTPFQWEAQNTMEEIEVKQKYLSDKLRKEHIRFNYNDVKTSVIEALFARGDKALNAVIATAFEKGAMFDGWSDFFNYDLWLEACKECGVDISKYVGSRDEEENLPWDCIDVGISKQFLLYERKKALSGEVTNDCRNECSGCGISKLEEGLC